MCQGPDMLWIEERDNKLPNLIREIKKRLQKTAKPMLICFILYVGCDGHIFITVLAYHLLHTIRFKFRQKGVRFCWTTIRNQLSTQTRITTTMR